MRRARLSANTGFLFKDRPFLERIVAAGASGFDAVEFHDEWRGESDADIAAALRQAGRGGVPLPVLGINARMGENAGTAAVPGDEERAREDIDEAVEAAARLGARAVHVLAGKVEDTPETERAYVASLAHACARAAAVRTRAAPDGLTVLIEPLSERAMPVYPLRRAERAAWVIRAVARRLDLAGATGAERLRIMFDLYHVRGEGDPILETFTRHAAMIGHVQISDPETRRAPRARGTDAVGPLLRGLMERGYAGAFGCEYVPTGRTENDLDWRRAVGFPAEA